MNKKTIFGYMGKILRINLKTSDVSIEEPSEIFYRRYFGGRGFIAYYLLRELKPRIDPLGPQNKLIFACGPVIRRSPNVSPPASVVNRKIP